jgi:UDP:flavonoid glycosyltransferase YjiC (YdhE family)
VISPAPVIVAAMPLTGHTRPMLAIARLLAQRGRDVTFLGASRFADDAVAAGARFVPLQGAADFDDRRLAEDHPGFSEMTAAERREYTMAHLLIAPIPDQYASVQKLLEEIPDATLLHDLTFYGMWPQHLGAPGRRPRRVIGTGVFPLIMPGAELTPEGPPPPMPGLSVREAAAVVNKQYKELLAPALVILNQVLRQAGATEPLTDWFDAVHLYSDAVAQLTVPSFDYPRPDRPESIHLVGAVPPDPVPQWERPSWWPEVQQRRVVVVTQGTMTNSDLTELVQPALDALAGTDFLVVVALGREPAPGELKVPDNARVAAFLPFDELLPHAEVLVTNGGYGAVQQALAHGLPLVVAGATEEKAMIAIQVEHFGVGVGMPVRHAEPTAIADAVRRVLDEPEFRARAAVLQAEYAAADPIAAIIDLIDQ